MKVVAAGKPLWKSVFPNSHRMAASLHASAGETSPYPGGLCGNTFFGLTRVCATVLGTGTAQIMHFVYLQELAVLVSRLRLVGVVP